MVNHAAAIFSYSISSSHGLSTKAKVIEASEKEKFMVKEIVTEFNVGKT
jgi:hypothetical protein